LTAVELTTTAFLDYVFEARGARLEHLLSAGTSGGDSLLAGVAGG
jgi:hypothetical protein